MNVYNIRFLCFNQLFDFFVIFKTPQHSKSCRKLPDDSSIIELVVRYRISNNFVTMVFQQRRLAFKDLIIPAC